MLLINISDNIMINPEKVDAVEMVVTKENTREIIIYVNGKRFTVTKNVEYFLRQINQPDLSKQFVSL